MKNKDVNYYLWEGEDLKANCYHNVTLPNGDSIHGLIGQVEIQKGDALTITHGRNFQVYTMSGKGYEAEFPYGRAGMYGLPVSAVLNAEDRSKIKFVTTSEEEFDKKVEAQKERVKPQMLDLIDVFILDTLKKREEAKKAAEQQKIRNKALVSNAVEQMEAFFSKKPRI